MSKWIIISLFCGLVTCELLNFGESNLRARRRSFNTSSKAYHFHHNPLDYVALETIFNMGTPSQLGQFIVDTTTADVQVTLCPNETPSQNDQPCFNHFRSSSFDYTSALTAHDRFDSALGANEVSLPDVVFMVRSPHAANTGRIGLAWPSLHIHPEDTSFPLQYLKHWQRKQFSIALALNGCEGLLDWGNTKNCPDNSLTKYIPLSSKRFWQFSITGFEFGKFKEVFLSQAIVASTKEYIGMPRRYLAKMMEAYGIQYDGLYGAYSVDCNATIPDFSFYVNDVMLTIKRSQLIYSEEPLPDGKCVVNFEDSTGYLLGLDWYFGLPIMTSYCVNFDYDGVRLGFTPNTLLCQDCHCDNQ